jgi:hypothetical protein
MYKRGILTLGILVLMAVAYTPLKVLCHPAGLAGAGVIMARPPGPVGHLIRMSLTAERSEYRGPCPTTVRFRGEITMDGPGNMVYNINRSDGTHLSRGKPVHFNSAGTQKVVETWMLGKSYRGWLQLASGNMRSEKAEFSVTCNSGNGGSSSGSGTGTR